MGINTANGQIRDRGRGRLPASQPANVQPQDSLNVRADTVVKGDIETTIKYTARDSIITDQETRTVHLYGDAKVTYGEIELDAAEIHINYLTNEVDARGVEDSTGTLVGVPKFKNGAEEYEAKGMVYNFKTKKGIINQVITQQGEGFVHGETVKKDAENNMYIGEAIYTTCNLAHPHFHISADKIKVVHDKQLVTGPFHLVISDVPTPFGFLFGIFPFTKKKPNGNSGIIFPTYGEEPRDRGFFLRDGGYYWAVSEYMGISFLGEIYSRGGWGLSTNSNYRKRYRFSGSFNLQYNRRRNGEEGFQEINEDFWLRWSHVPESRGTGRFSASVNAGTSTFNTRNARDISRRISPTFNSNVSYSNSLLKGAVTYSLNARHDMNTQTGIMNLTLPDLNVSVTRIYPFKRSISSGNKAWYETLSIGYSLVGNNRLTNAPSISDSTFSGLPVTNALPSQTTDTLGFNIANLPQLFRQADIRAQHSIPVSMSLKLFKYFSLNPSLNYTETWYPYRLDFNNSTTNPQGIEIDTLRQFSRTYSYSASAGLTTRIYGTKYFKNSRRLEAIRHTMIPNVSLSYSPDFSRDEYGFYENNLVVNGDSFNFSRFPNGSISTQRSGSIGFSLNNTLEAKVRPKSDTAGAKSEKVSIIDNLGISTSYNLAADSLNLSPINFTARTRILQTDINFGMTIDPYSYIKDVNNANNLGGIRISEYAWKSGKGLGQISSANMYFSKSFSPKGSKKSAEAQQPLVNDPLNQRPTFATDSLGNDETQIDYINADPSKYVDFKIPWTFGFSYALQYAKRGFAPAQVIQTLTFNGDLKITDKWKIGVNSGYDFVNKGIVNITSINIYRDLHCWEMTLSWIPFGQYQSYSFDLRVRASILQDLKLSRRRSWYDR